MNIEAIMRNDAKIRNLKLRTVPGWFGIPVGQMFDNGKWVNTPPGLYEKLSAAKANYIAGKSKDPVARVIYDYSTEFKRLEGMALDNGNYTTIIGALYPGMLRAADITADELQIFEDAGNKALNATNKEPQSYDSAAIEDWAKAVAYGTVILTSLKNQMSLLKLQPLATRDDDSYYYPWSRSSLMTILASLKGLRIPRVCYSLSEIFTRIIQVGGAEILNSIDSQFVMPFGHGLTYALMEDQIDALDALQKAGLFANYIDKPLVPVNEAWLKTPKIVPYYSDWAQAICDLLPCESNSGGVAQHQEDWDSAINTYYNQTLGMSELYSAAPLFREDTGAATAAVFLMIQAPAADKLSFYYFTDKSTTTLANFPDNSARLDYFYQVAAARSATQRGIFGHSDNFMQYHTITGDESSWDRRLSNFIYSKIMRPKMPVSVLARILPSMTPSLSKPHMKLGTSSQANYGSKVK